MDAVEHPAHYGGKDDVYETIKVLRRWLTPEQYAGFLLGNSLLMAEIQLTSEIAVEQALAAGSDLFICQRARQSTRGSNPDESEEGQRRLIRSLLGNKPSHTVPFEHGILTVDVHCPAFVWWEWTRHRFQPVDVPGLSFSLESGRYRELEPVFWVPRPDRPMAKTANHKPMRPQYEQASLSIYDSCIFGLDQAYRAAWVVYQRHIGYGIAPEVARAVLGFGVYYHGSATGSPLAWMHFLNRRTRSPGTESSGYPLAEIEEAARKVESLFAVQWPITHATWNDLGRAAP